MNAPNLRWRPLLVRGIPIVLETFDLNAETPMNLQMEKPPRFTSSPPKQCQVVETVLWLPLRHTLACPSVSVSSLPPGGHVSMCIMDPEPLDPKRICRVSSRRGWLTRNPLSCLDKREGSLPTGSLGFRTKTLGKEEVFHAYCRV
jgi:hypothetical protein